MEDRIIKWLQILLLAVFCLTCIYLLTLLIQSQLNMNENFKNWDPLAFSGSIIGGILTFYGVLHTIRSQQRENFMNAYPKIILALEDLSDTFESYVQFINDFGLGESNYDLVPELGKFKENHKSYLVTGALVDTRTFFIVRSFVSKALTMADIIMNGEEKRQQIARSFKSTVNKDIDELRTQINEYLKKYNKYTAM